MSQSNSQQIKSDQFDIRWAAIAMFGTFVSIFIASEFSLLRLGLFTPSALVIGAVMLIAAAAFSPLLLPSRGVFARQEIRTLTYPLISLTVLASVLLAFYAGKYLLPLYPLLALAGMVKAARFAKYLTLKKWLITLITASATATYLFITVNNLGLAGVYTPEQGLLGLLNHDTRFHTAITHLIQNFGIPSLGVDGMLPVKYHFGSHYWFAAYGLLTGAEPLWSYAAIVPIAAVPALLLSLLFSSLALNKGRNPVMFHIAVGLALLYLSDWIGWKSYYISETYTFGLIGLLLLLPLFAYIAKDESRTKIPLLILLISVAVIPALMSLKVSVGVLWGGGVGWLVIRQYGISRTSILVGAFCMLALALGLKMFAPSTGDYVYTSGNFIMPFYLLRVYPEASTLSSFVFPISLLFFSLTAAQLPLRKFIKVRADILVEAIMVITIAGALPAFLGVPQDSAAWYFLNVGQWFALPVLLSRMSSADFLVMSPADFLVVRERLSGLSLARPISLLIIFGFSAHLITSFTPALYKNAGDLIRAASQQGGDFLGGKTANQYFKESLKTEHVLFGHGFTKALQDSIGPRLIVGVNNATQLPANDFAVFIPPENKAFWDFQSDCRDKHNIQASLTGQPSLLGEPPVSYNCIRDAYQTNYGTQRNSQQLNEADLCAHAATRYVKKILVVRDLYARNGINLLSCQ